jgi:hypothetical protein
MSFDELVKFYMQAIKNGRQVSKGFKTKEEAIKERDKYRKRGYLANAFAYGGYIVKD